MLVFRSRSNGRSAGFTLVELAIAVAIMATLMTFMTVALQQEARGLRSMQSLSFKERTVQDLFNKLEQRLDFAQGVVPQAAAGSAIGGGENFVLDVDDSRGFPFTGRLLIAPGTVNEERVDYEELDPNANAFLRLARGVGGTPARGHGSGTPVFWAGTAFAIEEQVAPPANTFDGQSRELRSDVFFRGDGHGFAYRVPVDPAGGTDYVTPTGVRWGSEVSGNPSENGFAAVTFDPVAQLIEANTQFDYNRDGDLADTFDLGRIICRTWDGVDGTAGTDTLALSPAFILQEQNNWGGDLDNDGFADPIFLWTPESGRLRIRFLAVVGEVGRNQVVKPYETVLHLRNGAAD